MPHFIYFIISIAFERERERNGEGHEGRWGTKKGENRKEEGKEGVGEEREKNEERI